MPEISYTLYKHKQFETPTQIDLEHRPFWFLFAPPGLFRRRARGIRAAEVSPKDLRRLSEVRANQRPKAK